ncbi:MAG: formylmethanofuran dehydrogenase [Chloroflexi bacterium]|nr:formylmethanofuran dehydrogenase [Chloroflexota bacterium]
METLDSLLQKSASFHHHLCPRQVLGVRMGMLAGEILGLDLPQADKRLLVIAETDGCAVDGISVATGCWVGRRTLRIEDYGKVAATFVDTRTETAIRIVPRREARQVASDYAPSASNKWEAQVFGYQCMPAEVLFTVQSVRLCAPLAKIISQAGKKVVCERCQEEIVNEREVDCEGVVLCRSCAGEQYYELDLSASVLFGVSHLQKENLDVYSGYNDCREIWIWKDDAVGKTHP